MKMLSNHCSVKVWLLFLILSPVLWLSSARAENPEFAFILKARGNPFWKTIAEGIKDGAKEAGINASIYQIEEDRNSESQLNLCNTIIEKKPTIIVLGAVTKTVGLECYKKALSKNIPVADIDGNVTVAEGEEAHLDLSFSVSSDNYLIGQKAADYLQSVNKVQAPRILVIEGLPGNTVSQKRVNGFRSRVLELIPQAEIVASLSGDWDRLKAANITTDILTREKKLDYIFSASDVMTYGIIESVRVAKRPEVKIISVDAQFQILPSIRSGRLLATVAQLPYVMGRRSVELARSAVNEGLRGKNEFTDIPVVDREFLERKNNPTLEFIR